MTVEYRDIPGYRYYRVGNDGSVWSSHPHWKTPTKPRKWFRMKPGTTKGYQFVRLVPDKNSTYIHRIVLIVFRGTQPEGMEARHLDGDRGNNALDNLVWGSRTENAKDRERHGTWVHGVTAWQAKIDDEIAAKIKQALVDGGRVCDVARTLGVSPHIVGFIKRNRNWKHIPWPEPSRPAPTR